MCNSFRILVSIAVTLLILAISAPAHSKRLVDDATAALIAPHSKRLVDGASVALVAPRAMAGVGQWRVVGVDGVLGVIAQGWGIQQCIACVPVNLALLDDHPAVDRSDTNRFDQKAKDTIATRYVIEDSLQVSTVAVLRGGTPGSNTSHIGESFVITNISDEWQHAYFVESVLPLLLPLKDLSEDLVTSILPALFAMQMQLDAQGNSVITATGLAGTVEEVVTPGFDDSYEGIPLEMMGSLAENFVEVFGLPPGDLFPFGFTLRWELDLAPGASWILSKDKLLIVPNTVP